jgi:hypothetical protein
MGSLYRTWALGLIGLALMALPGLARSQDILKDAEARAKIEAQRVEREFTERRASAYRRVRANPSSLPYALDTLEGLQGLVRDSRAISDEQRNIYEKTLKYDLKRVREIASAGRAAAVRSSTPPARRDSLPPARVSDDGKGRVRKVEDLVKGRRDLIADTRRYKSDAAEGRLKTFEKVEKSARPQAETYKFPANWAELSKRRSAAAKMTEREKAIMSTLNKAYKADYDRQPFQDVIDHLRKVTGLRITVDKKGLEEAGAGYDTPVTLKNTLSLRSILKKINGELGLAYVIKDETILITSQARASRMTTLKTYYLGDLVAVANIFADPITSQLVMGERVNMLISQIVAIDPQSWQVNNPDAAGTITFHPATMSLLIRQTAEFHFKMAGAGR